MKYGICHLSIVPLRLEKSDQSELVNQVIYGDTFKVLEKRKNWCKIRLSHDSYEGWIDRKQFISIEQELFEKLTGEPAELSSDIVQYVETKHGLMSIPAGSDIRACPELNHSYDGSVIRGVHDKPEIVNFSLLYLNCPYLWGGRGPFGIDCSGFTQMVYRLCGHRLLRDASQQATQGEPLSFIEESEPGDLVFFDNEEGNITHVGIIMEDNHIIHAHGKVRIDRLDHTGIFNRELKTHTHKLRVIKRIV